MTFRVPLPVGKYKISQGFGGNAAYYRQFGQSGHNGIDYAADVNTPVYAADEGTVAYEGWGSKHSWMGNPAGICVLINHVGSYAGYAHLSRTVVNKGQRVKKGQLIGYVGSTGAATGPHLHFEMLPLKPNFKNGFAGRMNVALFITNIKYATVAEIKKAYNDILERPADANGLKHYQKYTYEFVRHDLNSSAEKRRLETKKAQLKAADAKAKAEAAKRVAERRKAEEAAKQAQAEIDRIKAEEQTAERAAEKKASEMTEIMKQNNSLLQQLIDLIKKLLKIGE